MGISCLKLALVSGSRDSGKTACLAALAKLLSAAKVRHGGIITQAEFQVGRKCIYNASSAATGKTRRLLKLSPDGPKVDPRGFAFAARVFSRAAGARVLLADEFGPLEASGEGFMPALLRLEGKYAAAAVSVRPSLVKTAARALPHHSGKIFLPGEVAPEIMAQRIFNWLLK